MMAKHDLGNVRRAAGCQAGLRDPSAESIDTPPPARDRLASCRKGSRRTVCVPLSASDGQSTLV